MFCVWDKSWLRILSSYEILEKPHDATGERHLGLGLTGRSQFLLILGAILRNFADRQVYMESEGDIILYVRQADNYFH